MTSLLAGLLCLLLLLALLAVPAARHRRGPAAIHAGCAVACAGLAALGVAALAAGGAAAIALPLGPPDAAMRLALDPLSAWFLLLLGVTGALSSLAAIGHPHPAARSLPPFPAFLSGMALTLAADDGFTLLLGFEAMSLASWALVAADHRDPANRAAARAYLSFAAFAAACLIPAFGLLAGAAGGFGFDAVRASPPEGARAGAIFALALAGAGAKAGLVPLHAWLPRAHPAAPSHISALMSGAMTKVALYVLARVLFDLCGPAQPAWWGLPLLVVGAVSAVIGALRATQEADIKTLLACSTIENVGLITLGLGLALAFRGSDLGTLAGLAAGGALLHALNHAVFKTLLFLGAGAVAHAAGSRRLERLGGLIHPMPATAAAFGIGAAAAAALPPLPGFAGEWLLLQSLLAAWQVGDIAFQVTAVAAAAAAALAAALGAAAMLRLGGLLFLGRPRSPRAVAAHEITGAEALALRLAAALTVGLGLLPAVLVGLAAPAIALLGGPGAAPPIAGLALITAEGNTAYAPLPLALLLALAAGGLLLALRRWSPAPIARGPVWNCGFIDPGPLQPFGDPLTQPGPAGMAQPLRRMLGETLLLARERLDMPAPGDTRPGRYTARTVDPAQPWLIAPITRARDRLARAAEPFARLTLRDGLGLGFGALLLLLALVAWLEAT